MTNKILLFLSLFVFASCGSKKATVVTDENHSKFQQYFYEGEKAKMAGNFEIAINYFNTALKYEQVSAAHYEISKLSSQLPKFEKMGIEHIRIAVEMEPTNSWYLKDLAYYEVYDGNIKEGIKNFDLAVKYSANPVPILNEYLNVIGNYDMLQASVVLAQIAAIQGEDEDVARKRFELLTAQEKFKEAGKVLEDFEKKNKVEDTYYFYLLDFYRENSLKEEASKWLKHMKEVIPNNGKLLLEESGELANAGNDEKSYELLKRSITSGDLGWYDAIDVLKKYEELSDEDEKFNKPLWEIFDLTFNQFKSEYQCLVQLSFVANHQDNLVRQEEMLRLALALYKSDVMVWQFLFGNQKQQRKWNELVKVGNEALELFPTDAEIYYFTGLGYLKLQDYPKSLELLITGRDLVIEDPELLSQFYSSLGSVYFKTDNWTECENSFEQALIQNPDNATALNNYAYYLGLKKVQLDKALGIVQYAVSMQPNNAIYLDTFGFILFQKKQYESALKQLQIAVSLNGNDQEIWEHLGDTYFMLGNEGKALECWNKALVLNPSHSKLKEKINQKKFIE
ncbi:MAG: tetratricopeptide repeat protein [Sediminibacterium sp.]